MREGEETAGDIGCARWATTRIRQRVREWRDGGELRKPFPTSCGRGRKPCTLLWIGPGTWVTKCTCFQTRGYPWLHLVVLTHHCQHLLLNLKTTFGSLGYPRV